MACIALAALNFGVMRLLDDLGLRLIALTHTDRFYHMIEYLVVGALPMLNALGIVLVIGLRRRQPDRDQHDAEPGLGIVLVIGLRRWCSHRFVWGFVLLGAIALALDVVAATSYLDELVQPVTYLLRPIGVALQNGQEVLSAEKYLIIKSFAAVILFLPQLAFALVGGLLFHFRIRVAVERRERSPSDGLSSH
jgi:hypothetical protein